jgi:hypothetical protein
MFMRITQFLDHAGHIVGSIQLLSAFLTSVHGPDDTGAWPRIHSNHHTALPGGGSCVSQRFRQIRFQVVSAESKFSTDGLFDRAQHHLNVMGRSFVGFEMARAMSEVSKENQHLVHPPEISASNADASHASAMWQRDLKPITELAIFGHHQKPLTPFFGHGNRQRVRA